MTQRKKDFSVEDVINRADELGITLMVINGELKLKARPGVITPKAKAVLSEHKQAIIHYLNAREPAGRCADCNASIELDDRDFFFVAISTDEGICYCSQCRDMRTGLPHSSDEKLTEAEEEQRRLRALALADPVAQELLRLLPGQLTVHPGAPVRQKVAQATEKRPAKQVEQATVEATSK